MSRRSVMPPPSRVFRGHWLYAARHALGITPSELAAWADISPAALRELERGRRRPTERERRALVEALGLKAYLLFPRTVTMRRWEVFCRRVPSLWFGLEMIERQPELLCWTPCVSAAMRRERRVLHKGNVKPRESP